MQLENDLRLSATENLLNPPQLPTHSHGQGTRNYFYIFSEVYKTSIKQRPSVNNLCVGWEQIFVPTDNVYTTLPCTHTKSPHQESGKLSYSIFQYFKVLFNNEIDPCFLCTNQLSRGTSVWRSRQTEHIARGSPGSNNLCSPVYLWVMSKQQHAPHSVKAMA